MTNRFRRLRWLALASFLLVPILHAMPSHAAAPVTIVVWTQAGDSPSATTGAGAGYVALKQRFEQLHPTIKVNWQLYTPSQDPSTYQTLLTAIAGGKAPDIAEVDRFLVAEFAEKGVIQPLGPYLPRNSATLRVAHLVPGAWQELHGYDGKLYGITNFYGAVGFWSLYYNKALFKVAGIKNPPQTWAELNADAKLLTKSAGPRIVQLGYDPYPDPVGELENLVYAGNHHLVSANGKKAELNAPPIVASLQEFVNVIDAEGGWDKVSRVASTVTTPAAQDPWFTGRAGMTDGGDWYLQTIAANNPKLSFGVVPLPTQSNAQRAAWAGGWSVQLVQGAAHPKEAAQFLEYLSSKDAAQTFVAAYSAYDKAHRIPNVIVGGLDFAYPSLIKEYSTELKATYPDLYSGVLAFVNAQTSGQYEKTFARDRNAVPGELYRAVANATGNALFHRMSAKQALTQQNATLQHAIDTFYKK